MNMKEVSKGYYALYRDGRISAKTAEYQLIRLIRMYKEKIGWNFYTTRRYLEKAGLISEPAYKGV
jgi:hypothetical protein